MPRVTITADGPTERVTHSERVSPSDFETAHFREQLAERVAWAVEDAEEAVSCEKSPPAPAADSEAARRAPAHAA
jgi:hypothetical protein